jgi:hypothetical protein
VDYQPIDRSAALPVACGLSTFLCWDRILASFYRLLFNYFFIPHTILFSSTRPRFAGALVFRVAVISQLVGRWLSGERDRPRTKVRLPSWSNLLAGVKMSRLPPCPG